MAKWEAFPISQIVQKISENQFVLPVIQRRLVWEEDKMELLFDTILKGNAFGGIMSLEEDKSRKPLFAFRYFTKDGSNIQSTYSELLMNSHQLIIDGQQRLQSFYIGLCGSYNGKMLYFDLFSDYQNLEFDFRFAEQGTNLPKTNSEKVAIQECLWVLVPDLFNRLKETNDQDQVSEEFINRLEIKEDISKAHIQRNINRFYNQCFAGPLVGIAKVTVNLTLDENSNRLRIVELFERLNQGGTRLNGFELVASKLKAFEWGMERFLDETLQEYGEIGLTQDNLIKLIFILRDNHIKEMTDIEPEDARFAVENKERIKETLKVLKELLSHLGLLEYYREGTRSFIPIFFIIYSIFHSTYQTNKLNEYTNNWDINNQNFKNIFIWLYLSLLSGVFKSKGAGWIPYKTGVRKILKEISKHKGKLFPTEELFKVYEKHPVDFYREINVDNLNRLDRSLLFYLIYDRSPDSRKRDIDHIHPYSLLFGKYDYSDINSIENNQLLEPDMNRGVKSAKPLDVWINNHVLDKPAYLKRHLIPENEELWNVGNFMTFLEERRVLIISKLNSLFSI